MSVVFNLVIAGAVAVKTNKKVEECYAITAMLAVFLLYIPGLYFSFTPGILIFTAAFLASAGYLVYKLLHDRTCVRNAVMTPGMFFLIVCMTFFALYCSGRSIDHSDDFYCWNLRIKNLLYFGKIKGVLNTDLNPHPPIVGIWDYLAAKTWMRTPTHALYLWAQNVLLVSFFAPLFGKIEGKQKALKAVLVSAVILLIPTLDGNAYHTLLVDTMLGAVIFFNFYAFLSLIRSREHLWLLGFIIGMCFLAMTKQAGSIFFVIVLFICVQSYAWFHDRSVFKVFAVTIAVGSVLIFSWYAVSNALYIIIAGSIAALLCGILVGLIRRRKSVHAGTEIRVLLLSESVVPVLGGLFIAFHYEESIVHLKYVIEVVTTYSQPSFLESVIDILIIVGLIHGVIKWKKPFYIETFSGEENSWNMGIACASYAIGVAAYFLSIWYLEIVSIGPSNGGFTGLNIRYFLPLLTPLYGLILYSVLKLNFEHVSIAMVAMMLATHAFSNEEKTNYYLIHKPQTLEFNEFKRNNITLTTNDHVFFIDEHDDYVMADRAFYNYICPATSQFASYDFIQGGLKPEMEETAEELEELLIDGKYNYVYIQLISNSSIEKYQELFESSDDIGGGRLYEVIDTENGIRLRWLSGNRNS